MKRSWSPRPDGLERAFSRVAAPLLFGALPFVVLVVGEVIAVHSHALALDFRGQYYPQAQTVLAGGNPYPLPEADLSSGVNQVFPIPVALLVAPLTIIGPLAASVVWTIILVACFAGSFWLVGVRDWRVYGLAVALWAPVFAAIQTGNLTIVLGLLIALAWRTQDRPLLPGLALGVAIALKLFVWPLVIWLAATRRWKAAALASVVGSSGMLLVLPYMSLSEYWRLLSNLGRTFAHQSYNPTGFLIQAGASYSTATIAATVIGAALLVYVWRRRSYTVAVLASLVLSPIVWLHYLFLLLIPVAARQPRVAAVWFLGLGLVATPGEGANTSLVHTAVAVGIAFATAAWTEFGSFRRPGTTQPVLAPAS